MLFTNAVTDVFRFRDRGKDILQGAERTTIREWWTQLEGVWMKAKELRSKMTFMNTKKLLLGNDKILTHDVVLMNLFVNISVT